MWVAGIVVQSPFKIGDAEEVGYEEHQSQSSIEKV